MSAAERLLAQLQTISPSDVPSNMQLALVKQLRDLAHDLEIQARCTALPSSPVLHDGEDHYQEGWNTTGPSSDHAEALPSSTADGNDLIIDDNASSASWETMGADGSSLPFTPCPPSHNPNAPVTPPNEQLRPPNPYEEYAMGLLEPEPGELDTTYGFDHPPLESSNASQFLQGPGPDRQMGLFVAKRRPSTFPRTPSPTPAPSSPGTPVVESDHDNSIPLPAPKKKKAAWWEPDIFEDNEGSSPFESLPSGNSLPTDLSFSHDSQFIEGGTSFITPRNASSSEHTNEESASTEPSSFLIDGTELVGLEDPFWGQTPISYPTLNDPVESVHNQFREPVNRSHRLFLDMQAVRQEYFELEPEPELPSPLSPRPSMTLDIMPVVEAAGMPLPPSPPRVAALAQIDGPLNRPSMWNRLTNGVMRVVRHNKKKGKEGVINGRKRERGGTLRSTKSLAGLFGRSPGKLD